MRAWPAGLIGLLSTLLWAGLWSWETYQPSGKGKSGPIQMPLERVQEVVLCTAWIAMLKVRLSRYRLIFNMGIPYLGKMVFILRRGPGVMGFPYDWVHQLSFLVTIPLFSVHIYPSEQKRIFEAIFINHRSDSKSGDIWFILRIMCITLQSWLIVAQISKSFIPEWSL